MSKRGVDRVTAATVISQRRAIRRDLIEWARFCGFEPAAHHRLIIKELMAIAEANGNDAVRNLALFLPPGSAKTTYASILFPSWYLSRFPDRSVIAASHTYELAEKWGRQVRNAIVQHSPVLGLEMSNDSQAAGAWSLKSGGEYRATGVGSAIVGHRSDCLVIDDPVRGGIDAESERVRETTFEWYKRDLITRLKPGGVKILIQTRWHLDDLAGRILAEADRTGEKWTVINLPAEALPNDALGRQPGEMLWGDDGYGYARDLKKAKLVHTARDWSSQFQQNPVPDQGGFFQKEWLRSYEHMPPINNLHIYGASDFATKDGEGDYTVHLTIGVDQNSHMYVLDMWRKQADSQAWVESWCDNILRWKYAGKNVIAWAFEKGQIRGSTLPWLRQRAKETSAFTNIREFPTRGSKSERARAIQGRMSMLGLYVPIGAAWYPDFLHELLSFPVTKHDDIVDCLGLIGQMLGDITPGEVTRAPPKLKVLCPDGSGTQEGVSLTELFEINEGGGYQQRRERV